MTTVRLAEIRLPDFGRPEDERPEIPAATYGRRVDALRERAETRGYDRLVVYADREHSANLSFLTGFDPRFEEAVLIVGPAGEPAILVGNECWGMAGAAPLADAPGPVPGPEPARASRATDPSRSTRSSRARGSGRGAASGSSAGSRMRIARVWRCPRSLSMRCAS